MMWRFLAAIYLVAALAIAPGSAHAQTTPAATTSTPSSSATTPAASDCAGAASQGLPTSSAGGAPQISMNCQFCSMFRELELLSTVYSEHVFATMAPAAVELVRIAFMIQIIFFSGRIFFNPASAPEFLPRFLSGAGMFILSLMLLSIGSIHYPSGAPGYRTGIFGLKSTNYPAFVYIFDFMQAQAIRVGEFVIARGQDAAVSNGVAFPQVCVSAADAAPYALLWSYVESVGYNIILLAWSQMKNFEFLRSFAFFFLSLPYLFVMGVFAAFLIQTMFYFLAISAISPLLIAGLAHEKTRHYFFSAMRILMTGSFTIIFASLAMGFTGSVLGRYLAALVKLMDPVQVTASMQGSSVAEQAAQNLSAIAALDPDLPDPIGASNAMVSAMNGSGGAVIWLTSEFWAIFLMGFVSVLLHLAAPRIAANIGGAQDSAASAAAVTAAGHFTGAKLISTLSRLGIGTPGRSGAIGGVAGVAGGLLQRMRDSRQ